MNPHLKADCARKTGLLTCGAGQDRAATVNAMQTFMDEPSCLSPIDTAITAGPARSNAVELTEPMLVKQLDYPLSVTASVGTWHQYIGGGK